MSEVCLLLSRVKTIDFFKTGALTLNAPFKVLYSKLTRSIVIRSKFRTEVLSWTMEGLEAFFAFYNALHNSEFLNNIFT